MTGSAASPVPIPVRVGVHPGPALLAGVADGPSLPAHRARYGDLPTPTLDELHRLVSAVGLRGRGGAAFPFATKLEAAARGRRPVVVVNLSEGEPASAKDSALALSAPHLVLDGAVATARALGAREVHLVLPGDRPMARLRMLAAVDERHDKVRLRTHTADPRFVAGQARAVVELMSGRTNLPVTAWAPEAVEGYRRRPTLLSNAETWAQVGRLVLAGEPAYRRLGTGAEPGTTLLTHSRHGADPEVREVPFGTSFGDVLPPLPAGAAVLVGGFHGAWTTWGLLAGTPVSVPGMAAAGLPLGAGIVHVPATAGCPLGFTSAVVDYLAGQSAGRCGPCVNGLPALADAVRAAWQGRDTAARVDELAGLLTRRGACAHPDGTVRMVRSLFTALPAEVAAHRDGACVATTRAGVAP
ncbi:NADH-ubiquinone oxidoreductase-F iron-sulfur binding region domain-containing protein [Nocardioides sp. YIM 152588]|uniref:NADH-ubiquinone oxidoreductase-F iron-sulfur binding region domain-containing protein n=1 Tax=Nocardioides sp. YIM 152588 TaxID=3158259 RepID=UPI0032E44C28